ncbi:MAG: CpsD/CapB family tyrosine-protein kinase [Caulobacteraceae bacterium]|nr:CpsD/CapB family tyrosine-protein kinase [Caulobacteraceae bacterium]
MTDTTISMRDFLSPHAEQTATPATQNFGFSSSLVTLTHPTSPEAEAIRGLRSHIVTQHLNMGRRALAVCGASVGIGTTFTAANLAVALSQIGVNTLLVDANLQQPGLERMIRPQRPPAGLVRKLADDTPYDEFVDARVLPNLSVIYAGSPAANSMELLASDRFKGLMDFCLRNFEATIVDTPPSNRSHGAKQISSVIGYSLIVAGKGKTFVKDVRTLANQLTSDGVRVVGSVLCGA